MGYRKLNFAAIAIISSLLTASTAPARALHEPQVVSDSPQNTNGFMSTAGSQLFGDPWPQGYGMQRTGVINASFTSCGQFGLGFYRGGPVDAIHFETPSGSEVEYLRGGAIWIGGVVGVDTLVSVGADGWQNAVELLQTSPLGSVRQFPYISDYSMEAEFTDTTPVATLDKIDLRPHKPLNVRILNRSHGFSSSPLNSCIFYDMAITNIGTSVIHDGYVGFYMDPDIGARSNWYRWFDDLSGSLPGDQIACAIDNNGDFNYSQSSPKMLAAKFLSASFPINKTSFNWWISNGYSGDDFGPQARATYRNLGTGGMGTPEGDRNKYAFLCNGEWDYDQCMTATIMPDDSVWMTPPVALAFDISKGSDARFLLSAGPFELAPDSTVVVRYVMFTGDAVHHDPLNYALNLDSQYLPLTYLANLDFSDAVDNLHAGEAAADSLYSALNPPSGLRVSAIDSLAITLKWNTEFNTGMDGYSVYVAEIPDTDFVFSKALPIWSSPTSWSKLADLGMVNEYLVAGLSPCKRYAFYVRTRSGVTEGSVGLPPVFGKLDTERKPLVIDSLLFTQNNLSPVLTWSGGTSSGGTYRIYKYPESPDTTTPHLPVFSEKASIGSELPIDSVIRSGKMYYYYAVTPYAEISGGTITWSDPSWAPGDMYRITAIDACGFESPFSTTIRTFDATRSKDILILYLTQGFSESADSVRALYTNALGCSFAYDFYSFVDSMLNCQTCYDWHDFMKYRLIIADGGVDDIIADTGYAVDQFGSSTFSRYLLSGGKLVYCGSLNSMHFLDAKFTNKEYGVREVHANGKLDVNIDSVGFAGSGYYTSFNPPIMLDTVFGFRRAEPTDPLFPELQFDTSTVLPTWLPGYRQSRTAPGVATFRLQDASRVLYRYRSLYPSQSRFEGLPVGLLAEGAGFETYLFGFHLWYLMPSGVTQLMDKIMNHTPYMGCCHEVTGNVNAVGIVDLADLSSLVNYLTGGGFSPPCLDEANVDASGIVDLSDLSALVSYLTGSGFELRCCQ